MATSSNVVRNRVFLSHAGADTQAAQQFAETLRLNGLEVWFDKDNLQPGDSWMAALEKAIEQSSAMLVYVGRLGVQAWVDREVRFGLERNTRAPEAFKLIPVLGEGADASALPPFLSQHQCADLRDRERIPDQIRRIIEVLQRPSDGRALPSEYWSTHSPFRSLQVFEAEDSWLFFGRDSETHEVLNRLGRAAVTAIIGNSGSGKSSLVRAGLIPALRRGRFHIAGDWVHSWRIAVFRPGDDPFREMSETLPVQLAPELSIPHRTNIIASWKKQLPTGGDSLRNAVAGLIGPLRQSGPAERILLIADQFEELFTLTTDKEVCHKYIDTLLTAAQVNSDLPVHMLLVLRADFYAYCLDHANLSRAFESNIYHVPRIPAGVFRQNIEKRLALAGAQAESGLLDSLLADVGEEPGNLALLEHALGELWDRFGGVESTLTSDAYAQIGRLRGALGKYANKVYNDIPTEEEKRLVQRILLELVQLGEGAEDTRRRISKERLLALGESEQTDRLLAHLASRRLILTGGKQSGSAGDAFVEVSHEALIREWPELRNWIEENRENLRLERRLMEVAEEWQRVKQDSSALL